MINFMIIFLNLWKTIGIFRVEYSTLGRQFNHFQTYSIKINNQKIKIRIAACFWLIFYFELNGKGHKPSRAENPSARAIA